MLGSFSCCVCVCVCVLVCVCGVVGWLVGSPDPGQGIARRPRDDHNQETFESQWQ